ncbi:MAG: hypothetical protein QM811_00435 [Pirellulales bacterium]
MIRSSCISLVVLWTALASAADARKPEPKIEVLLSGLASPADVAVRPLRINPVELCVLERGAGRIVKTAVDKPGVSTPLIVDFPVVKENEPGPRRIRFLDQYSLLVASQGNTVAESHLVAWPLDDAAKAPSSGRNPPQTFGFASLEAEAKGFGRFVDAGFADGKAYLATVGLGTFGADDETSPRATAFNVLQADWSAARRKDPKVLFNSTKALPGVVDPVAFLSTPRLEYLVVAGEQGGSAVRRLTFIHPQTGRALFDLPLPLALPVALAYQVSAGKMNILYALDRSTDAGGLYRIDVVFENGKQVLRPFKIVALDRPNALASGEDGTLYVVIEGAYADDKLEAAGQLLKIGGL